MVDSYYASNLEDRFSLSGYVNTIGGMITNWMSKTQKVVTLSITEAEYVALTLCCQETMFQNNLLEELGVVKKPGWIYEDNTGAIFLVENSQVSIRTKHIDIRCHFIRQKHSMKIYICEICEE